MAFISLDNRVAFLGVHPLFARLAAEQRREIAAIMGEHRYKAGETVFLAGDPADRLYIVVSGTVRINILSPEGREILLNVMRPNDIFGEIALLDNRTRTASVVALTDCHFLSLARGPFLDLLNGNASLMAAIYIVLVDRIRYMGRLLENFAFRPVEGRIPFVLGLLADRHGHRRGGELEIDLKISQSDLGALAHATRQTVNRELKRLERLGLIRLDGRKLVILDREGLDKVVHSTPPIPSLI